MIRELIERCGAESVSGFGRLLVSNLQKRNEAAKAAGIKDPTFILCDHEFAAVIFYLSGSVTVGPYGPTTPVELTEHALRDGFLLVAEAMVVSEGRAMAQMRDQAERNAAGKMGFN